MKVIAVHVKREEKRKWKKRQNLNQRQRNQVWVRIHSWDDLKEDLDVKSAMEALQKQRDDSLLLIKTEHQMRLDSANKLATFEEERLNEFYEVFFED